MTIDFDLPCARCGYNLRTLPRGGVCPECATKVRDSEAAREQRLTKYPALRARGEPWMSSVVDAFYIGLAGWFASMFVALSPLRAEAAKMVFAVAAFTGLCWFGWRLFPGRQLLSGLGKLAIAAAVVCTLANGMDESWARYHFGKAKPPPWPLGPRFYDVAEALGKMVRYIVPVAIALVFLRLLVLTRLARRPVLLTIMATLTAAAAALYAIELAPSQTRQALHPVPQYLKLAALAAWLITPIWLGALIWHFNRAIELGELPLANSRS